MAYFGSYVWRLRQLVGGELIVMPGAQVLLIDQTERVYLQRRKDVPIWEIPAGTCEPGSSFEQTARDEVREETGLIVDAADLVAYACISDPGVNIVTYPNGDRTHCFSICFFSRRWTGEIDVEESEVLEGAFYSKSNLPDPLHPSTKLALELYTRFTESAVFQVR